MQLLPDAEQLPHRLLFARATYTLDREARPESGSLVQVGKEAEGRPVFADLGRSNSRKHIFLATSDAFHVGYTRPDLRAGITLVGLVRDALPGGPDDRRQALALQALLSLRHVVLLDGQRLGAGLAAARRLVEQVTTPDLRPDPVAAGLPLQALAQLAEPFWDDLSQRLASQADVRALQDPDFGFVLDASSDRLRLAKTTRDPVDEGELLLVQSASGLGLRSDEFLSPRRLRVVELERDHVYATPVDPGQAISRGDPVRFAVSGDS